MLARNRRPVLSEVFNLADHFRPRSQSIYVYGDSAAEPRYNHLAQWRTGVGEVTLLRVSNEGPSEIEVEGKGTVPLRSARALGDLWTGTETRSRVYVDITSLSHHVWAPLIKSAYASRFEVLAVYVEPYSYRKSAAPLEGQIYDLSDSIQGISPLPGMASLAVANEDQFVLVALLGFEGTRLAHIIEQVQPSNDDIVPVIGCPGFKPEFLFEAYTGNRRVLMDTSAWHRMRYATGNCPFHTFDLLGEIFGSHGKALMKIALVGTKPHALGAVMYKLCFPDRTELIHDHPKRKLGRTEGHDRLLVYHVSSFLTEEGAAVP